MNCLEIVAMAVTVTSPFPFFLSAEVRIISNLMQEVRRLQDLLEEVDSELNDLIHVTRRGYTFLETGVPPPPP